ncbi:MAG: DJ-1/PfpI family protein [Lachnospiraceae bacterium]|nr:DJ-1/PfpI family protein [Lachnospiraceae bacterium]
MSRVCVFLAEGFEEIEGLTVVDLLRRAGVETQMVSITEERMVTGSHGIQVQADVCLKDADFGQTELLVLPGGMPGTKHLGACQKLTELLTQFYKDQKKVAAICAAPSVLGDLGILKGKKAACYPGFEERLAGAEVVYDKVAADGNVTTSRGMGTAIAFSLSLVEQLVSREKALELKKGIIYGH